jgi:myosin-crossreactive antigen
MWRYEKRISYQKSISAALFPRFNYLIIRTKKQNEILRMVCDLYETEVGEYIKDALIESLKEEITDGDFCGLLASKLDDSKKAGVKAVSGQVNGIGNYPFVE